MSVRRRTRFLGSMRLDVPIMRSIESAVSSDFDDLLKGFVTGSDKEYVIRGFELNMTGAIGGAASGLQMLVASSSIFHGTSKESGTFYTVPSNALPEILNPTINPKVRGTFVPNAVNYVGIEYERFADPATADILYFWNPVNKTEFSSNLPLAQILRYTIVITTSIWANNVLPIAKVTVDIAGNVSDITDQRPMLFRLGTAGRTNPNPAYVYPWTNHSQGRAEEPSTATAPGQNPFRGGDKQLYNLKEWADAVMSSFKEIKGTTYWYSLNTGGSLVKLRQDLGNTLIVGRGNISHSGTVPGRINWSQDIRISLIGSRLFYTILANPSSSDVTLSNTGEQTAYINLVRDKAIIPNLIWTNGSPVVQSVGAVSWTSSLQAGDWVKISTDDDSQYYRILTVDSLSQVTLETNFTGTSTGPSGTKSLYSFGVYQTSPTPTTDRHVKISQKKDVPFTEDIFWFLIRSDSGGSKPRVYVRFLGSELEEGEEREISDNTTLNILTYIGSNSESSINPNYSTKLGQLVKEVTEVTTPAASSITTGQHFLLNSYLDTNQYYVWYNKDGLGGNPYVIGKIPIEVAISTGDTATQVAIATASAINSYVDFTATNTGSVVEITNAEFGTATDASNVDVAGLTISVTTQGSGVPNFYILDPDDLTLSIKKLDKQLRDLAGFQLKDYEERIDIIAAAPTNPNELQGPISAGTNIVIPPNSRDLDKVLPFSVGSGELEVYLNGQKLNIGASLDYTEVGPLNSNSVTIQIQQPLVIGDILTFRIDPSKVGLPVGGVGEVNNGANLGTGANVFKNKTSTILNFRRLNAGSGVTITENTNDITISAAPSAPIYNVVTISGTNYTATVANDYILFENAGANRTITLPTAVGNSGKLITVKKIDLGNTLSVATVSGQEIDGVDATATPLAITVQYETVSLLSDGSNWFIV